MAAQGTGDAARDGAPQGGAMVCVTCGATAPPAEHSAAAVTWARGLEQGRVVWTCPECSRRHLRSIEGKLDTQWW